MISFERAVVASQGGALTCTFVGSGRFERSRCNPSSTYSMQTPSTQTRNMKAPRPYMEGFVESEAQTQIVWPSTTHGG